MASLFVLVAVINVCAANPPITAAAFAPDGKYVLIGSQAGIEVREWPALTLVRTLTTELGHVHDIAFSPQQDQFAAVGGSPAETGAVEFWTWPMGSLSARLEPHEDLIYKAAWRSDG